MIVFCAKCGANVSQGSVFCPSCGSQVVFATPSPPGPAQPVPAFTPPAPPAAVVWDYATWGTRAIGYLIDSILIGAAMAVIYLIAGSLLASFAREDAALGTCCMVILLFPLASLVVGIYNRVYLVSQRGYSIGQGVVKVKVVDANGQLLSQGTALIRLLAHVVMGFVPFLPVVDLLWPLWDQRRQTLHDKAVGCYVINNPAGV
jgi:uncharacterized RDD family membrane protein YckC